MIEKLLRLYEGDLGRLGDRVACVMATNRFAAPGYMELFLTENCNQACDYCFVRDKSPRRMSWDVGKQAIDFFLSASKEQAEVGVLFFGGEPLLEFRLIQRLVEYGRTEARRVGKRITFDVTTNGTLLDETKMRYFQAHGVKYLVSIDGDQAVHDRHRRVRRGGSSFDRIMSKFRLMKRYQPWQGARVTVHPDAARQLCESIKCLFGLGFNQFIVGPAHSVPWSPQDIDSLRQAMTEVSDFYLEMKKRKLPIRFTIFELGDLEVERERYRGAWGCGAGRGRVCIGVEGDIYGCSKLMAMGLGNRELFRLGDVWSGFTNYRGRLALNDGTTRRRPRCRTCAVADFCTGNCPATNFETTGSLYESPAIDCAFTKLFHETNRYLLGQLGPEEIDLLGIRNAAMFDPRDAQTCRVLPPAAGAGRSPEWTSSG